MIIGVGTDIIEIKRIEKLFTKYNFFTKFFTDIEVKYLSEKQAQSAAGYFCAKEAVVKAMGTGFSGFDFKDIEIVKAEGKPEVVLHNRALDISESLGIKNISISISHCKEYATAVAVAEG